MLPEKLLFVMKLLLCLLVVVTEGKKKNREQSDEPPEPSSLEETFNMCDIKTPVVIYCYCDTTDLNKAEEGNCWIFNDVSKNESIWEGFVSQSRIKRLTLHLRPDGTLTSIPTVAVMQLPSLEMFEVQYANFSIVRSFSFGNSTTLTSISLSRNSIATLSRHAFTHLPYLDILSLGENQISEINRHVFVDLPRLTKLYIDRNNITIVHDRAFQGLHSLRELDLFSNQIHVITPGTFRGLQALERLDLHKNRIEVIGDKTFRDLQFLKTLDLQENSLKYIATDAFHGLQRLRRLNLQDNKLLTLRPTVFSSTPAILHLDIRANVLETLSLETMQPLLNNLNNETMNFLIEGNNFRCDNRLSWIFSLRNSTRSMAVRRNLDEVICYLEGASMPPRLADDETVTPAYETTTLGIGPMMRLLALREEELPDPMTRWMQTANPDDCPEEDSDQASSQPPTKNDDEKEGKRRGGRPRNGRKRTNQKNKAQNDMASIDNEVQQESLPDAQPPVPIQESHALESGAPLCRCASPALPALALLLLLLLFQSQPL